MAQDREYINPVQAAMILGVTASTLALWRCYKTEALPFYREDYGRRILYKRSEVEAYAEKRKRKFGA